MFNKVRNFFFFHLETEFVTYLLFFAVEQIDNGRDDGDMGGIPSPEELADVRAAVPQTMPQKLQKDRDLVAIPFCPRGIGMKPFFLQNFRIATRRRGQLGNGGDASNASQNSSRADNLTGNQDDEDELDQILDAERNLPQDGGSADGSVSSSSDGEGGGEDEEIARNGTEGQDEDSDGADSGHRAPASRIILGHLTMTIQILINCLPLFHEG